jgi:hypothetical protein
MVSSEIIMGLGKEQLIQDRKNISFHVVGFAS